MLFADIPQRHNYNYIDYRIHGIVAWPCRIFFSVFPLSFCFLLFFFSIFCHPFCCSSWVIRSLFRSLYSLIGLSSNLFIFIYMYLVASSVRGVLCTDIKYLIPLYRIFDIVMVDSSCCWLSITQWNPIDLGNHIWNIC